MAAHCIVLAGNVKEGDSVTINILNLLWIVPLAAGLGVLLMALLGANKTKEDN